MGVSKPEVFKKKFFSKVVSTEKSATFSQKCPPFCFLKSWQICLLPRDARMSPAYNGIPPTPIVDREFATEALQWGVVFDQKSTFWPTAYINWPDRFTWPENGIGSRLNTAVKRMARPGRAVAGGGLKSFSMKKTIFSFLRRCACKSNCKWHTLRQVDALLVSSTKLMVNYLKLTHCGQPQMVQQ